MLPDFCSALFLLPVALYLLMFLLLLTCQLVAFLLLCLPVNLSPEALLPLALLLSGTLHLPLLSALLLCHPAVLSLEALPPMVTHLSVIFHPPVVLLLALQLHHPGPHLEVQPQAGQHPALL